MIAADITINAYEYVESALHSQGGNLIVVDNKELKDYLVEDMTSVKAKKALEAITNDCNT